MDQLVANTLGLGSFLEYTRAFKIEDLRAKMEDAPDIPVLLVTLYLSLIFYVPTQMEKRKPINLKTFFAFWNLLLTVFSVIGSYYCVPRLLSILLDQGGLYKSVCDPSDPKYANGEVGFWVAAFILSKIPELMDTVFLVLQKKDVIFLHWFHHVTVMLYCWHAYLHRVPTGLWFATMNYCVHAIMYFYYFLTAIGARAIVKPIAPLITSLQLLQMVVGMSVTAASFFWSSQGACDINPSNNRLGLAMYTSYFILFAMLFKKLYLTKKPTRKEKAGEGAAGGGGQKTDTFCKVDAEQFEELLGSGGAPSSPTKSKRN